MSVAPHTDALGAPPTESSSRDTFPLTCAQSSVEIDGVATDIVCLGFADGIQVLVTQLGKIGCLVKCSYDASESFDVDLLLRSRDDAIASALAQTIGQRMLQDDCRKPLILGVALKPRERSDADELTVLRDIIRPIVEQVVANKVW